MATTNLTTEQRTSRVLPAVLILTGIPLLIGLARADGPAGTKAIAAPSASTEPGEPLEKGRVLYRTYCSTCHSKDGRASRARLSTPAIPDFTHSGWQAKRTDAQLTASIRHGLGDDMPSFDERLNAGQTRDLVAYVRGFGPVGAKRVETDASDFDSRYRQLQAQWDELERQRQELARAPGKP